MPRNWQSVVTGDNFSDVMKLVHLVFRQTTDNEEAIRAELVKARRREYEDTITALAAEAGCRDQRGRLTAGDELTELNELSRTDAESMVNTYNFDLAVAIMAIRTETPTANRHTMAKRLGTWETNRAKWKDAQVSLHTHLTARSAAQKAFMQNNGIDGAARLVGPNPAQEEICQGWLNRGEVPAQVAQANPSPYHPNCPHLWEYSIDKSTVDDCDTLWTGA